MHFPQSTTLVSRLTSHVILCLLGTVPHFASFHMPWVIMLWYCRYLHMPNPLPRSLCLLIIIRSCWKTCPLHHTNISYILNRITHVADTSLPPLHSFLHFTLSYSSSVPILPFLVHACQRCFSIAKDEEKKRKKASSFIIIIYLSNLIPFSIYR